MNTYNWSKDIGRKDSAAAIFGEDGSAVVWKEEQPRHYHVTAFWTGHMLINTVEQHITLDLCMAATEYAVDEAIDTIVYTGDMPDIPFDSRPDTWMHIARVRELLTEFTLALLERSVVHDVSKLHYPEKDAFDETRGTLKDMELGSDAYQHHLASLKPVLDHHYQMNSHHPEHYEKGIDGMGLTDLVEMLYDWKASSEKYSDDNLKLTLLKERFGLSQQLFNVFRNEITLHGWKWV